MSREQSERAPVDCVRQTQSQVKDYLRKERRACDTSVHQSGQNYKKPQSSLTGLNRFYWYHNITQGDFGRRSLSLSRGHIKQCCSNAGLRVEGLRREGWDGGGGNVRPRLALEVSKSWFSLLLVPESRETNNSSLCLLSFPRMLPSIFTIQTERSCTKYMLLNSACELPLPRSTQISPSSNYITNHSLQNRNKGVMHLYFNETDYAAMEHDLCRLV